MSATAATGVPGVKPRATSAAGVSMRESAGTPPAVAAGAAGTPAVVPGTPTDVTGTPAAVPGGRAGVPRTPAVEPTVAPAVTPAVTPTVTPAFPPRDMPVARSGSVQPKPAARKRRLLLATDLGDASASATDQAFDLARNLGASLVVVSVIDPGSLALPGGRFRARVDQVRERLEAAAQELVARGRGQGIDVSFLIWTGDPGDQIVEAAIAEGAEMIVVGSHGRGAVGRLLLGSVSEHVVRNAHCPVLVVR